MNSIIKPVDLFKRAAELNMPAIAVTDNYTFAGISDSYKAAKTSKVKMIVGSQFNFVDSIAPYKRFNEEENGDKPSDKIKNIVIDKVFE